MKIQAEININDKTIDKILRHLVQKRIKKIIREELNNDYLLRQTIKNKLNN